MKRMRYNFQELPLIVISPTVTAGDIDGYAELDYFTDGTWNIHSVYIECFRRRRVLDAEPLPAWPKVEAPDPWNGIIRERLEKEWFDQVTEAVLEEVENDRIDMEDQRADMRRDARMDQ